MTINFKEGFIKYGLDHGYIKPKKKKEKTITFEDNGAPLKKSKNRQGETCEAALRRMCKNIANDITDGLKIDDTSGQETVSQWMKGVYDIRYIVDREKKYLGAKLMVAGGGPTIWVNTLTNEVEGYWASDRCTHHFLDNIGLDEYNEEMYNCD